LVWPDIPVFPAPWQALNARKTREIGIFSRKRIGLSLNELGEEGTVFKEFGARRGSRRRFFLK
jgi:hypothetical protein